MIPEDAFFGTIADNLFDGLYIVDRNRVIRYWNKAAERITGFTAGEVVGRACADNILTHVDGEGCNLCLSTCPLSETMDDGKVREAEVYLHHKNGRRVPVSIRTGCLRDADGNVVGAVDVFTDADAEKAMASRIRELEELALLDGLTRIPNRRAVERELEIRLEEHRRFGVPFGVLFMDIDRFKDVNDHHGHDIGDRVLQFVAGTLNAGSRPFDTVGRWGGEEFLAVVRNVDARRLEDIGNRLRNLVAGAYIVEDGKTLSVTISIGATLIHGDDDPETLLKRADTLLYESKRVGRNRLTIG
jgi:diguanylate cyclase (GGDEF)-like protein/PAS domain S-box-containing protein